MGYKMLVDFDCLTVIVLSIIWLIIALVLKFKCNKKIIFLFFFTVFYIYICFVIKYTLFPIIIDPVLSSETKSILSGINLIPIIKLTRYDLKTSVLNIIMTIPLGIGSPVLRKNKTGVKSIFLIGLIFSCTIESIQFLEILLTRIMIRAADINDVIFNVIGALSGFYIYKAFIFILNILTAKLSINENKVVKFLNKSD
jgi:glycopeptide antibiotics resistance protein